MRAPIICRTRSRVKGPLVHRKESDPGIVLQERLSTVSVMDIPVHHKHAIQSVHSTCVGCAEGDVSEDAETHGPISQRMVTGRSDTAETPCGPAIERAIHGIEDTACSGCRRIPGSFAHDCIDVESTASRRADAANGLDVRAIVNQSEFIDSCMTSFDVLKLLEQLVVVPEGAHDRDEATDVLRVPPTSVMPPAIRVRDECCATHCLN